MDRAGLMCSLVVYEEFRRLGRDKLLMSTNFHNNDAGNCASFASIRQTIWLFDYIIL